MNIESIAKVAHELNAAFCASIGDDTQKPWDDSPKWQKESAILGVQFVIDNEDAPPSSSHKSWLRDKVNDGWVYGPVKNAEKKEHPCIVPYDKLPTNQKSKDYIFKQVVLSLKQYL